MSKLSRREREEKKSNRRLMIVSGVSVGLLSALAISYASLSSPPADLTGKTLPSYLSELDYTDHTLRLAGAPGAQTDIFVVGSSTCNHCQNFVATGADGLIEYANENDVTVDYMALGNSPGALASTRALECMLDAPDPLAALRETYAISSSFSGATEEEFVERVQQGLDDLGIDKQAQSCLPEASDTSATARLRSVLSEMNLQGTPSFYVTRASDESQIVVFSGFSSESSLLGQVQKARGE